MSLGRSFFLFLLSLLLLVGSSEWIVTIGTSLPELAATVVSSLKNEHDLAVGNVVGLSLFNLLLALPMPALFAPSEISSQLLYRDYPAMLLITFLFWFLAWIHPREKKIALWGGCILLSCYVIYALCLGYSFLK